MKTTMKHTGTTRTNAHKILLGFFSLALALGMIFAACEGPTGSEGPQGPRGSEGPIGPAGEDGSMIYAGKGVPAKDLGKVGDYYLNTKNGKFYGPKDKKGWGKPIIVLMGPRGPRGPEGPRGPRGPEGPRGPRGPQGPAGEDGSQIYAGNGPPKAKLGKVGDYYLNKKKYHLYGPKTKKGWGTPLNLKGADGNANVTRYIFTGQDFSSNATALRHVPGIAGEEEMRKSEWLVYLVRGDGWIYHIPGGGALANSLYAVAHRWHAGSESVRFWIRLYNGLGETYSDIEIVRIEATDTVTPDVSSDSIIPDYLDVSKYKAVAEYYGFGNTAGEKIDPK